MYQCLGKLASRYSVVVALGWMALLATLVALGPQWLSVTRDGEFAFLPEDSPSRVAENLYREAFTATLDDAQIDGDSPEDRGIRRRATVDPLHGNVVIVVRRTDQVRGGLQLADWQFVNRELVPRLERIAETIGRGYAPLTDEERELLTELHPSQRIVTSILAHPEPSLSRPPLDPEDVIGSLLVSEDEQATLVVLQLTTEFLDRSNNLIISEIERLLADPEFKRLKPHVLALDLSGSAVVGRDVLRAEQETGERTETMTKGLVVILLLVIYRAPLMALIPLLAVGISVEMTRHVLRILAGWGWIEVFSGLDIYVTVVVYGAGVDYCLFLISRYREELQRCNDIGEAIQEAVRRVGAALAASAGTSIIGIGMMAVAEFGKFQQAGIAISLGLTVSLLAALTLTPALLRLCGRWAFWPDLRQERLEPGEEWLPTFSLTRWISEQRWLERGWKWVADLIERQPLRFFVGTILLLLPFACVGVGVQNQLSYGMLTDLPGDDPSVVGAKAVQEHFPDGIAGPMLVLVQHPEFRLESLYQGKQLTEAVDAHLRPRMDELGLADIRSQAFPLGVTPGALKLDAKFQAFRRRMLVREAQKIYTSTRGPHAGRILKLEFILSEDPFLRDAIGNLPELEAAVRASLPEQYRATAHIASVGPTSSLRDLKIVTDRDRLRIDILVLVAVYLVLIALLRRPAISAFLLATVLLSYFVTLGCTYLVYSAWMGDAFVGLDWKIPLFLFTILIAMGEDYNILLLSRVLEEQPRHGHLQGVLVGLRKTGGIISSCGVIMAGTFATLMSGTLMGLVEMGFALAFGVLLDTFVVRPVLVPAYLVLLYGGWFGRWGRWLGAPPDSAIPIAGETTALAIKATSQLADRNGSPGEPTDFESSRGRSFGHSDPHTIDR
jgi:RND superfamily putative drug exporter